MQGSAPPEESPGMNHSFQRFPKVFLQGNGVINGSESLGTPWNTPEHPRFCFRNPPEILCLEAVHCFSIEEILMFYSA